MSKQEPSGEVPGVSVSGSQGVIIGSGNNQYNAWMPKPPLDPAALAALNPHTAVDRLLKLSHDEIVDFFANAKPVDVAEILAILLYSDRLKFIAILGDISRRQAADLIATIDASEVLRALPDLAQEISREAASHRLANVGLLQPAEFPKGIVALAYFRRYENGRVWSSRFGTYVTAGRVDQYCATAATKFHLGVPVSDLKPAKSSQFGTNGLYQEFERGTVYSSVLGDFCVTGFSGAGKCYRDLGGTSGWLGFPVEDCRTRLKPSAVQNFEGGAIYTYSRGTEQCALAVRRSVISSLPKEGWCPVSKEVPIVSSSGKAGSFQLFEVKLGSGIYETAIYWESENEPVMVEPEIWDHYSTLGAEKSRLGLPVRLLMPEVTQSDVRRRQFFEEGTIYWKSGGDPIVVSNATNDFLFQDPDLAEKLGFPVTEEYSVNSGESDSIQYFENGVVTMRDGKYKVWGRYKVWVRPESKTDREPEPGKAVPSSVPPSVSPAVPSAVRSSPTLHSSSRQSKPVE